MKIKDVILESNNEKIAGIYDPEDFDAMVKRVGDKARKQQQRNPVNTADLARRLWGDKSQDKKTQDTLSEFSGEYDDEAGMAKTNLVTIARAVEDLLRTIDDRENLPEWLQEKIAKAEGMLVSAWDYLKSQEAQGIDPRIGD
jgi:molecular chaperone DnaK (HSP70)